MPALDEYVNEIPSDFMVTEDGVFYEDNFYDWSHEDALLQYDPSGTKPVF